MRDGFVRRGVGMVSAHIGGFVLVVGAVLSSLVVVFVIKTRSKAI